MYCRVLACDFDGTGATNGELSPEVAAALAKAPFQGIATLLVTGRVLTLRYLGIASARREKCVGGPPWAHTRFVGNRIDVSALVANSAVAVDVSAIDSVLVEEGAVAAHGAAVSAIAFKTVPY